MKEMEGVKKPKIIKLILISVLVVFLGTTECMGIKLFGVEVPGTEKIPDPFPKKPPSKSEDNSTISRTTLEGCAIGGGGDLIKEVLIKTGVIDNKALYHLPIGTLVGCSTGWLINQRREKYAKEANFYDAQIQETKKNNESLKILNQELENEIAHNNETIAKLKEMKDQSEEQKRLAKREYERAEANANLAKKNLAMAEKEIEVQEEVLKELEQDPQNDQDRIEQLRAEKKDLETEVEKLNILISKLDSQPDAIGQFGYSNS